jgi:hypothetical protein
MISELDCGYIKDAKTEDSSGIAVVKGSLHNRTVNVMLCMIHLLRDDISVKVLMGFTIAEKRRMYDSLNRNGHMKAIIIEKAVAIEDAEKKIISIDNEYNFAGVCEVFEDVMGNPTEENIRIILGEYETDNAKTLYGYFSGRKLTGITRITRNPEHIEILHFGIHPEYRGRAYWHGINEFYKERKPDYDVDNR